MKKHAKIEIIFSQIQYVVNALHKLATNIAINPQNKASDHMGTSFIVYL